MNNSNQNITWQKSKHNVFETFALELKEFTQTRKLPASGDQDVRYGLELQQKRLKEKNLIMKYDIVPRGLLTADSGPHKSWKDEHYISEMEFRTCELSRSFYRNQKKVYETKENSIFYQIITNVYNRDMIGGELYTCPNCGAISKIEELQNGCSYCGTFFEISDLFPKVTNYFFVKDSGSTQKELKHSIGKVILPCILFSILAFTIYFYFYAENSGSLLYAMISGVLGGALCGTIVGYIFWAFMKVFTLLINAGKSIPMVVNSLGSNQQFVSRMKQYSSEFSYEYFSDKVVSMLKMILFSEDAQNLPNYVGEPVGNLFLNIVEASYAGAVALKQFQVQGNDCYVTVDVYMEDIYDDGRRIYSKNDTFRVYLCKNISKPINYHFSIKKIQCKGCGGSFDATKQRTCPICGKRYEIEEDDWIILKIQKR